MFVLVAAVLGLLPMPKFVPRATLVKVLLSVGLSMLVLLLGFGLVSMLVPVLVSFVTEQVAAQLTM